MMSLKIKGLIAIEGMEFHNIEGGFGEGKKSILAKDIADIHRRPLFKINELINNNRKRFKDGVDVIDFLNPSQGYRDFAKENGLIGSNRTKNVYLLSERGYSKLLKILDDDLAWDQYDKLVDNYFNMRQVIKSDEEKVALLTYKIYKGGQDGLAAANELSKIESEKEKRKLYKQLEPTISIAERFTQSDYTFDVGRFSKIINIKNLGRNNLYKWMREKKILMSSNEPYQKYMEYFKIIPVPVKKGGYDTIEYKTLIKAKGIEYLFKKLIKDGKIITKSFEEVVKELESYAEEHQDIA